jgi:hypothetical protein
MKRRKRMPSGKDCPFSDEAVILGWVLKKYVETSDPPTVRVFLCCAQQTGMHEMVMEALLDSICSTWVTS